MQQQLKEFSKTFFLSPPECTPMKELPMPLLVNRIIEVSTLHANKWGVGYTSLIEEHQAWVLSRVTVEMFRYPMVNEDYTLTTWIEDYNRHFSQRNVEITDAEGNTIGYARTIWVVIDSITRESVDISKFSFIRDNVSDRPCPIDKQSRLKPIIGGREVDYSFRFVDLDFNQHVNTVRYVELFMNQLPLERYEANVLKRFEIAFMKECYYGQKAHVKIDDATDDVRMEVVTDEHGGHCRSRFIFEPRPGYVKPGEEDAEEGTAEAANEDTDK